MCDFNGKAYVNYLIGDQRGFYYTVGAWYDGSVQEFLERQFK